MKKKNFYNVLKVLPNASHDTICTAFEILMEDLINDNKTPKKTIEKKIKELYKALEILTDPIKRSVHDKKNSILSSASMKPLKNIELAKPDRKILGSLNPADDLQQIKGLYIEFALEAIKQEAFSKAADYLIQECAENRKHSSDNRLIIVENIANLSELADNPVQALKYINKALDIEPENIFNLFFKASLLLAIEEEEKAFELYDETLEMAETTLEETPDNYILWLEAADAYVIMDDFEMAGYSLENAIFYSSDTPEYTSVLLKAADSFYEMGWLKECLDTTELLKLVDPSEPGAWVIQGLVFYNIHVRKQALKNFKHALKINNEFKDIIPIIEKLKNSLAKSPEKTLEERIYTSRASTIHKGKVKWFDPEEGMGSIITDKGKLVILHYLSLKDETGFIESGVNLEFGILMHGSKGKKEAVAVNALIIEDDETTTWYSGKIVFNNIKKGYSIVKSGRKRALLLHSILNFDEKSNIKRGTNLIFSAELKEDVSSRAVLSVKKAILQFK